ncbi:MAG: hypothetical protein M1834_001485 [Cirrosporium novae-zelandiae]|nr:MAG: hypothetical protein M1834_008609 [Cirrosporium novae-zelandiae]KAI9736019.1 MAG: hypothetical protein M1834_001485 [Cirrosporium novae-zelandiae]
MALESRQRELLSATVALPMLALIFIGLRFLARWKGRVSYGRDDYLLLVSMTFLLGTMSVNIAMIHYGLGRHAADLEVADLITVAKLLVAFECVYCTTVGLIKFSLLLMYYRIFPYHTMKIAMYIIGFCVVGWTVAINFVSIFQCTPIRRAWNTSVPGTCINLKASFIGNGVPNFGTDIVILCLPGPYLWQIQTSKIRRISLILIFLTGSLYVSLSAFATATAEANGSLPYSVVFASIYRFTTIFQFESSDMTWTLATACTWCVIETATGVISACLPTLRPLMRVVSSKFASTGRSTAAKTPTLSTELELKSGKMNSQGSRLNTRPFQRLDDTSLQPTYGGTASNEAHAGEAERESVSGDEIPLNRIRVRREVDWNESAKGGWTESSKESRSHSHSSSDDR